MNLRRSVPVLVLPLVLACTGGGDSAAEEEAAGESMGSEPAAEAGGEMLSAPFPGSMPDGWMLRLDSPDRSEEEFRRRIVGDELRIETGPRGILYRPADAVSEGPYTVTATFTEYEAPPGHREAYGLIFGGSGLRADSIRYSYFLVRADGRYLVKRRAGGETATVVDWTQHPAVNAHVEGEEAHETGLANTLSVRISGESVTFSVNGTEVATVPASELDTHGVAGLRVNHRLNVGVSGFRVTRPEAGAG